MSAAFYELNTGKEFMMRGESDGEREVTVALAQKVTDEILPGEYRCEDVTVYDIHLNRKTFHPVTTLPDSEHTGRPRGPGCSVGGLAGVSPNKTCAGWRDGQREALGRAHRSHREGDGGAGCSVVALAETVYLFGAGINRSISTGKGSGPSRERPVSTGATTRNAEADGRRDLKSCSTI